MAHQVVWTKKVADFFAEHGNLTAYEKELLETRIAGMTITEQSFYFSRSISSINRTVAKLKKLYDEVQKEYPMVLKPRRFSQIENYQDEH